MWESDGDLLSLRLGTGLSCPSTASGSDSTRAEGSSAAPQSRQPQPEQQQRQEKITIFYNGRICVCDVTEIQARTIINMAKREMDDRRINKSLSPFPSPPPPPSPHDDSMPQLLNPGLSMKRSLQRFLQKRKTRIDATAPYEHRHRLLL